MKYYVTADTHGFYSVLRKALEKAGYFDDRGERKLIILGDLFDRGTEAKEMQDFILQQMETGDLQQGRACLQWMGCIRHGRLHKQRDRFLSGHLNSRSLLQLDDS